MYILGISSFYHDSSACLIEDGKIVAAAQEERFTRIKHDSAFPSNAINYCLNEAGIDYSQLNLVAYYEKPFLKLERILETYLAFAPIGIKSFLKSMPVWIKKKIWIKELISKELNYDGKIIFPEHHESHASSAFFPSPFQKAAFITMDGVGEWSTSSFGIGNDNQIELLGDIQFPHSLGLLYSAFTYYIGFRVNSGEYKVMGLAPYGNPKYKKLIYEKLIDVKTDGSFRLDMSYFNYCSGMTMTSAKFHKIFGGLPRKAESKITQKEMDLACSVQEVIEEVVIKIATHVKKVTGMKNLCLAGGVALNCVANGKLLRSGLFDDIWIQPASGDAGGSLGCAFFAWHQYLDNQRKIHGKSSLMQGTYLGPEFKNKAIESFLNRNKCSFESLTDNELPEKIADLIADKKVIGWFQGRMEFGPRSLGSRAILGDARSPEMQKKINLKIKFRESFRPFAPSIRSEDISDYFDLDRESPYMLLVAKVRNERQLNLTEEEKSLFGFDKSNVIRSEIPAVTHVDYSARVHSVNKNINPRFHQLLTKLNDKYGCPVIVNTSFNVRGEPIVCTPEDAYQCFIRTEMDYLCIGNFLLDKKKQTSINEKVDWEKKFKLD